MKVDKNGNKHAGGKPKAAINLDDLEKLCVMQCTNAEVASFFGVAERTIERRRQSARFAAVMNRGYAKGRQTLRRKQMELAMAGNPTMLIWLGKQLLGQRDKIEHGGPNGGPIQISEIKVTLVPASTPAE